MHFKWAKAALLGAFLSSTVFYSQAALAQEQQNVQTQWTPQGVRDAIAALKDADYYVMGDKVRELGYAVVEDEALALAAIEAMRDLLVLTVEQDLPSEDDVWREMSFLYKNIVKSAPGKYDTAIDDALKDFLASYTRSSATATGQELNRRLYNVAIVSLDSPVLQRQYMEELGNLFYNTQSSAHWAEIISRFNIIKRNYPGQYNEEIKAGLAAVLDSIKPYVLEGGSNAINLAGRIGEASVLLSKDAAEMMATRIHVSGPEDLERILNYFTFFAENDRAAAQVVYDATQPLVASIEDVAPGAAQSLVWIYSALGKYQADLAGAAIDSLKTIAGAPGVDEDTVYYALRALRYTAYEHQQFLDRAFSDLKELCEKNPVKGAAVSNLYDMAEDHGQFLDEVVTIMQSYLEAHANSYVADDFLELAMHHEKHAGTVLETIYKSGDGKLLREDVNIRREFIRIGFVHPQYADRIIEIASEMAGDAVHNKDWVLAESLAESLAELEEDKLRRQGPQAGDHPPQLNMF